ncbi:hypothetical protein [Saccharothrix yanglingensis]|uniref:hypothetical protein n=1 Tax=Saccharothrix yanglingensis TaxID=659496 RepID=UPI0027D2F94E|nr:hypothetical protein [Saccharothrix yanglingensis]
MLSAGAFDLLGCAVVESAALRDDGGWRGVDVDQAAVVVLPWQVRSADPEVPCECRVACDERAGFLSRLVRRASAAVTAVTLGGRSSGLFYDQDDPAGFRFPDEATAAAWHERGSRLVGRLASALRLRTELHAACGGTRVRRLSPASSAIHAAVGGADLEQAVELNDVRRLRTAVNGTG